MTGMEKTLNKHLACTSHSNRSISGRNSTSVRCSKMLICIMDTISSSESSRLRCLSFLFQLIFLFFLLVFFFLINRKSIFNLRGVVLGTLNSKTLDQGVIMQYVL